MRFAPLVPKPEPSAAAKSKRPAVRRSGFVPSMPVPPGIMTKLEIGDVSDPLEREADQIADRVMRTPTPDHGRSGTAVSKGPGSIVQRACASCEAEDELEEQRIMREPAAGQQGGTASAGFVNVLRGSLHAGGSPLPDSARAFLEPRLGVDLGRVRVHSNASAGLLASRISARAFTVGDDIFFAPGQLRPQTDSGMRLLVHEVAHTLQQRGMETVPAARTIRRAPAPTAPEEDPDSEVTEDEDVEEQPATPAQPGAGQTCTTFMPANTNTIVVDRTEFAPPAGVTVINWADPSVARKSRSGTNRRPDCRAAGDLTEVIVHETVSANVNRGNAGRPNVQLVLHRDGTFTQHADLAADLNHANDHNVASFGFETVNPVVPRMAGAPTGGLPNLTDWPTIETTTWANRDRVVDEDDGTAVIHNPDRHYVLPTDAQLEAATELIEWATDTAPGHGMNIPRDWPGRRGNFLLFGRDDALFQALVPGILAHGYFHHSDGYFIVLYAWLRLEQGLNAVDARREALDIADNRIVRRRENGGSRTTHAELTHLLHPPGGGPAPAPPGAIAPAQPAPGPGPHAGPGPGPRAREEDEER